MENGFAIAGDYMSAASFLGISGLIALFGYDGMLYSVGFLVAWLVVLLLVAELVRNCGRFTLADVVAARMASGRCVRRWEPPPSPSPCCTSWRRWWARGASSRCCSAARATAARAWTVIGVGALMVIYVSLGGMRATTWIQIVKAVLLMSGAVALTVLVLVRFHGDVNALLTTAAERSGHGRDFLSPGLRYGGDWTARLDFISLGLALVLGTAGLPHILSRFYTVPTARAARRSVVWSIGLIGGFYLMTIVLGFGAAALVGSGMYGRRTRPGTRPSRCWRSTSAAVRAPREAPCSSPSSPPSPSPRSSPWSPGSRSPPRPPSPTTSTPRCGARRAKQRSEVGVARVAAVGIGVVAIGLGLLARNLNVAFLVGLAFAVAASANLPVLLYSLFWRNFTTRGAVWSVYGGLIPRRVARPALAGGLRQSRTRSSPAWTSRSSRWRTRASSRSRSGFLAGWLGTVTSPEAAGRGQARGDRGPVAHGGGGRVAGRPPSS